MDTTIIKLYDFWENKQDFLQLEKNYIFYC